LGLTIVVDAIGRPILVDVFKPLVDLAVTVVVDAVAVLTISRGEDVDIAPREGGIVRIEGRVIPPGSAVDASIDTPGRDQEP
jgi:hypothetical protein